MTVSESSTDFTRLNFEVGFVIAVERILSKMHDFSSEYLKDILV